VANVLTISPIIVNQWASFAALFKEYCIVGVRFELRTVNVPGASQGGYVAFALDENSGAAPTAGLLSAPHIEMLQTSYSTDDSAKIVSWMPSDLTDLDWGPTVSPAAVAYLKGFASNAATLTQVTNTGSTLVTGSVAFAFRGYIGT
jgi:hypothetical protein